MCFYRSPTKLQEDNVFSCVFLSFCQGGGSHVTITHDALDLNVQPIALPPPHRALALLLPLLLTSGGQDWVLVQTCSLEDFTVQPPPLVLKSGGWILMMGQRVVGTLLECSFVENSFFE